MNNFFDDRMVRKYQDNPSMIQYMQRIFYTEKVFDDSSADEPILRWRFRNFFSDNAAYSQNVRDTGSQSNSDACIDTDIRKMNLGADVMEDPLDVIFGHEAPVEEIHHSGTSSSPARGLTGSHKRSHRRRRMHLHENFVG
uniref:Uncharacterized protein MANES_03G177200 n=1 Tax=Rhizophora mucronata TaxID=61149 RepID=A0A2P2KBW3_RHIMU